MQGLWAARWLADVNGLGPDALVQHMVAMALGLGVGAFAIGAVAERLRRKGTDHESILVAAVMLFVAVELAMLSQTPIPSLVLWGLFAMFGGLTALTWAILAAHFPRQLAARAMTALAMAEMLGAFIVQSVFGWGLDFWPATDGYYPFEAFHTLFLLLVLLQLGTLAWFYRDRALALLDRLISRGDGGPERW